MEHIRTFRSASAMRALKNRRRSEEGMTMVEIVVAFVILAFMTLAAVPLFLMGIQLSSEASTTTAAHQRVQQVVEGLRAGTVTCGALASKATTSTHDDGRGKTFRVTTSLPTGCSASDTPQSIPVKVEAKRVSDGKTLTTLTTRVFVPGTTP